MILASIGSSAWAQIPVGVMGDSYSDEYRSFGSELRNWVEILAESGQVDFGPFAKFPANDPRGSGKGSFTYNFARGGENTSRLLFGNKDLKPQLPFFIQAAKAGKFDCGILMIGGNDLLDGAVDGQPAPGLFTATPPNKATMNHIETIVNRIEKILETIDDNDANSPVTMILTTLPDLGSVPYVLWETKGLKVNHRNNLRLHVQAFNRKVEALAAKRKLPMLRLWEWWEEARLNGMTIAGREIDVMHRAPPTPDPSKLNHFFLADGIHPTPIAQALIANRVLAIIQALGKDRPVRLLTEQELLTLSGLGPAVDETGR